MRSTEDCTTLSRLTRGVDHGGPSHIGGFNVTSRHRPAQGRCSCLSLAVCEVVTHSRGPCAAQVCLRTYLSTSVHMSTRVPVPRCLCPTVSSFKGLALHVVPGAPCRHGQILALSGAWLGGGLGGWISPVRQRLAGPPSRWLGARGHRDVEAAGRSGRARVVGQRSQPPGPPKTAWQRPPSWSIPHWHACTPYGSRIHWLWGRAVSPARVSPPQSLHCDD